MSAWNLAVRNVFRNRRRSLLTAGVVVFGFAAFALAGGFMSQTFEGLRTGTIRGGVGQLQVAHDETFRGAEDRTLEHGIENAGPVEAILRRDADVAFVLPRIDFVGLVSNGSRSVPYLGVGFDPGPEGSAMDTKSLLKEGRWFGSSAENGVVLGTGLALALRVRPGETVTLFATTPDGVLNALDATVDGLVDLPVKEIDDRYLATTLPAASRLLSVDGVVSKLVLTLRPESDEEAVRRRVAAAVRASGLEVRSWRQLALFYNQVRLLYIGIFGFMGAVLVIVVLLACANTMTMAAAERTREIGTLRAIGTPPALIRRMFVAEGIVISIVGCVVGAVIALLVRAALNASGIELPAPPGASHGMPIHVAFYPATYGAGLAAMLATLALAAYFPARRASRMAIVEALAHV